MSTSVRWHNWPHVISMQQFSRDDLLTIITHAMKFSRAMFQDRSLPRLSTRFRRNRDGEKVLRYVRSLFYQASSRTEGTFESAATVLRCKTHHVKDPKHLSAAAKGESTLMGIAAYTMCGNLGALRQCDYLIIRHDEEGTPEKAARLVNAAQQANHEPVLSLPILNAGDGSEGEHPTQALVDLKTMMYMKLRSGTLTDPQKFLDGTVMLMPGELHRSRVINSLLGAFSEFSPENRIKVMFCCPEGATPPLNLLLRLTEHKVDYQLYPQEAFHDLIPQATTVYMTRPQREYDETGNGPQEPVNRQAVQFRTRDMSRLQPGAYVMHPLPINENPEDPPPEIATTLNAVAVEGKDGCVWLQQSHFGLPVRAALLDLLFQGMDEEADRIYGR